MATSTLQTKRRAIVQGEAGSKTIRNVPIPSISPSEILVKTIAVAINPTDHKMPDSFPSLGAIVGCDYSGIVVKVGSETSGLRVGDRVAGAVHGSNPIHHEDGAFAEYIKTSADLVYHVPGIFSWEDAAAIGGTGHGSLCLAFWGALDLPGRPEAPSTKPEYVLVYGGSTATGTMALQLLRLSGLVPIAVCSPHNFELAKSYDIRQFSKNTLFYALDCITDATSASICFAAIGRAGGRYASLEYCPSHLQIRRAIHPDFVLGYEMFGKPVALTGPYKREPAPEKRKAAVEWYKTFTSLCEERRIKAHPVRNVEGVLEGVLEGINMLKNEGVSGYKLVVRMHAE
ncbi:GroES-like protein [Zopfia rhizophila CBS 207.26]|uniref:GroES-like protein n=1 Tax=Zopfia rhizophila CBS 207.26 TaxID=1314779 RepID=A0A6A6E6J4_9PEZI|nr:GroES-like protein [Zopfia rhizophila CBS 207.26]